MMVSFIKRVFTFGDRPVDQPAPQDAPDQVADASVQAELEPKSRDEDLPVAADPVAPVEMDTAGGPSDDVVAAVGETADVEEEPAAILPGVEETSDLGVVPLSLLEAEAAAETAPVVAHGGEPTPPEASDEQPAATTALSESEELAEDASSTAHVLPKGFSTAKPEAEPVAIVAKPSLTWFQRLRAGLARTSSQLTGQISALFTKRKLDEQTLEELEDLLIQADLGVETAMRIADTLSSERYGRDVTGEDVSRIMSAEITKVLTPVAQPLQLDLDHKPHVILVVGVNGTGKTTTIGKLAAKLSGSGLKVMLAAGDTFRAAAIEQLKIWADRTGSEFIGTKLGADAAGLAYDAFEQARAKKSDVLIIDTAGRLQNRTELMAELEKIVRVLNKLDPDAPHTVLQTLDATTGQNAMNQVEIFRNVAGVSGLIMTKLDGTARGGILVAIAAKHKLPVYFIGVGEGVDDLEPFEAQDFAHAIAGLTH
ncbi:signal recognition particle-docking protein FtsY [Neorhizobium sp. NPDC001467]|uniref:signal recognition particle-docking protein FtsY n=1 Tax=Neorhizobium sp. NPDC001467 TaxID=3390595 RepID=UPI003D06F4B2